MSTLSIFVRTWPYVALRILAYLIFGVIALALTSIMGGIGLLAARLFKEAGGPVFVIVLVAIGILWGLKRLAERYFLCLIKAGHVAVITELILKGGLPAGVGQVEYVKREALQHFGSASAMAGVDALAEGAVRQTLRRVTRLGSLLSFVPGAKLLLRFVYRVLSIAGNFIDEAVLSYILSHEKENVWRAAADGVVLYVQSWKKILGTPVAVVIGVVFGWFAVFLLTLFPLLALASVAGKPALRFVFGFFGLIAAWLIANIARWSLVDPLATVAMVVAYNRAVREQAPSYDLYGTLAGVSRKFRELEQRARQAPAPAAGTAAA